MAKKHNWAPAPNANDYAGFAAYQEGAVFIGILGKRKVAKNGHAHYPLTLEEPTEFVFAAGQDGSLKGADAGKVVGLAEVPALRHLEQLEGKCVRISHVDTETRHGETRSRISLKVEVAQD